MASDFHRLKVRQVACAMRRLRDQLGFDPLSAKADDGRLDAMLKSKLSPQEVSDKQMEYLALDQERRKLAAAAEEQRLEELQAARWRRLRG